MKPSTGLRNAILASSSLKTALDGGEIRIYAGNVPASADAAIGSATHLCTIKNDGDGITFDSAADAGVLSKNPAETWSGVNENTGTATFFRHVLSSDTGDESTTALRLQGTCAVAGADLNLTSVGLSSGATQTIDFYSVAMPAGS